IHDLPEFLQGGVRDQTTHIIIRYKPSHTTDSLHKGKHRRHTTHRGPGGSFSEPSTSSIDEETEGDNDGIDGENNHHNISSSSVLHSPILLSPLVREDRGSDASPSSPLLVASDPLLARSEESCPLSRTKDWLASPSFHCNSSNGISSSPEESPTLHRALHSHTALTLSIGSAKSPVRCQSPDMESGSFNHRSLTPTIADLLSRGRIK
ncbi:hypothetical protein SK128_006081, partial [Halocaridina rubra]